MGLRSSGTEIELHSYQKLFLQSFSAVNGLEPGASLDAIVVRLCLGTCMLTVILALVSQALAKDPKVYEEIWGDFICIHCGSVSPADWIKNNKGDKKMYSYDLAPVTVKMLSEAELKKVEKVGDRPVKQVVDGPSKKDIHKAARVAIDWAIMKFDALADGQPKALGKEGKARKKKNK